MFVGNQRLGLLLCIILVLAGCASRRSSAPHAPAAHPREGPRIGQPRIKKRSARAGEQKIRITLEGKPARRYSTKAIPRKKKMGSDLSVFRRIDKALTADVRLDRAAAAVLSLMADRQMIVASAMGSTTKQILWWEGIPDAGDEFGFISGVPGRGLERDLENWLERQRDRGAVRYGMAERTLPTHREIALFSMANHFSLQPVPREQKLNGTIRLAGRVYPPFKNASLYITSPAGRTVQPKVKNRGQRFNTSFTFKQRGLWQVELVADGPTGPEPIANFPVAVGKKHKKELTIRYWSLESEDSSRLEKRLFKLLGRERKKRQLKRLEWSDQLAAVARNYAEEMARTGIVGHLSPESGSPMDRVKAAKLYPMKVSENLARAYSAHEAHQGLMRSPAHRANILNDWASQTGIGVTVIEDHELKVMLVVQLFTVDQTVDAGLKKPKKVIQLINKYRRQRSRKPVKGHPWLNRMAKRVSQRCFTGAAPEVPINDSPFKKIQVISFLTNNLAGNLGQQQLFFRPDITDLGISVVEGRDPKSGEPVVCVTALLGQR